MREAKLEYARGFTATWLEETALHSGKEGITLAVGPIESTMLPISVFPGSLPFFGA